jgi:2-oxoisovalerate dehydrogenase E1 component beta subunit
MALSTYIDAINTALAEEMRRDERVYVIGEDVGVMGGVFKATKGLYDEFGPERVIDSPLAEGIIISSSIGAALAGMRPVPEIQFSDFITPAMDALSQQAAKLRYRSAGRQSCPVTVRVCYGGGVGGGLYHSQTNTTWFAPEPGLIVVAPSTPYDAKGLLKASIRDDNPVIFFEHKKLYRSVKEEVPKEDYLVPLLKAAIRRQGKHVTAISYGYTLQLTLQAAERMKQEHRFAVEVLDLRTLSPLDKGTILESVAKTHRVVIIYEDHRTLGIGAEVSAVIAEEGFDCLDAPIVRVTAPDVTAIPFSAPLERFHMPSVEKIVAALKRTAEY